MKNKILKLVVAIISIFSLSSFLLTPAVLAANPCDSSLPDSVRQANGCPGTDSGTSLPNIIRNILIAIIGVVGVIAVIFIIIGGVKYITSSGDSEALRKAKNTILYAVIGLIICVLSFAIVNFTINRIIGSQTSTSDSENSDPGSGSGGSNSNQNRNQNRSRGETEN